MRSCPYEPGYDCWLPRCRDHGCYREHALASSNIGWPLAIFLIAVALGLVIVGDWPLILRVFGR